MSSQRALLVVLLGSLFAVAPARPASAVEPSPTFTRDVAPLLWNHCGACHRPGNLAPFSLLDYRDVRPRARRIAEVTASRQMPPWLPEPGLGFADERRLSDAEIALIGAWVDAGAPEGRAADLPKLPAWNDGWQLGQPDLVVQAAEAYTLQPGSDDVFRNFVIPVALTNRRWVRGVEIDPGNRRVVHHAALAVDRTAGSRALDAADREAGFPGDMIVQSSARSPQNRAIGWTPGMTPAFEPESMAWSIEPGSDLVLLLHLMPGSAAETLRPRVALYFTDAEPTRTSIDIKLGSRSIDIHEGATGYAIEDRMVLPADVDLLSIYPHAHYLATRMTVLATLPDGTSRILLAIRDWDFHWQEQYRFADPVALPKGTVVTMRYVYDNSASNRRRPRAAAGRVRYGPQSSDEMGDLWLRLSPRRAEDGAVLARAYLDHELQKDIVYARQMAAANPADPQWQLTLGVSYLEAGRPADALGPLQESVRLAPGNRLAHLNLANALVDLDRPAESIAYYERALAIDPSAAETHNNLGAALASLGRVDEAIARFQEALRLDPGYADARRNLDQARTLKR